MQNVIFSLVTGLLLMTFGMYGRVSGSLPHDNPYWRARHHTDPTVQTGWIPLAPAAETGLPPGWRQDIEPVMYPRWRLREETVRMEPRRHVMSQGRLRAASDAQTVAIAALSSPPSFDRAVARVSRLAVRTTRLPTGGNPIMSTTRIRRASLAAATAFILPVAVAAAAPAFADTPEAGPYGPACASVPKEGSGSLAGMAKDPVATAASHNPALSTLVTAVKKAGLVDTLNNAQNITVFAPTNDAFKKIPKADLDKILANKAQLTKILTYHVVGQKLTPKQLTMGTFTTLEGGKLTTAGAGSRFTVNGTAKIVCGDVQTANATVNIIDTVLTPM